MSDQKRSKSHQRELSPLSRRRQPTHCVHWSIPLSLKSLPCRLAATGANKVPRSSNHSVATATGSKRSSADSDSLLCHVGLWRTSRFGFGCASMCEHSEIGFILIVSSTQALDSRPPCTFSGRADKCVHESARLSRVICSHAWYSLDCGGRKIADFRFILCHTHSPRTTSCD